VTTASTTVDIEEAVTSVTDNSGRVDTPITIDSTTVTQDPPYPQRLDEPRMTS